jgi:hypothetical protein
LPSPPLVSVGILEVVCPVDVLGVDTVMTDGVAPQPYASAEISGQVYVTQERLVSEL